MTTDTSDAVTVDPAAASAASEAPAPSTDVSAASSPATPDVKPEESSPSTPSVESKQTLLDVARDVLAKSRQAAPAETQGSLTQDSPPPSADEATPSTPSDSEPPPAEDFSDAEQLPFGKHPRFKKLLSDWKADREPARQYRQVQEFLDQNGVSPDLAAEGLKQSALLVHARRGSAEHARLLLKELDTVRNEVRQMLGEEIPPDLQERIDGGLIDEASAKELVKARAQAELAARQVQVREQREQQQTSEQVRATVKSAVAGWESQIRTRDADYAKKAPLVLRAAKALAAERGAPRTAEDAVRLAQDAYDEVTNTIRQMLPTPRPSSPAAPRTATGVGNARPEPKTLLDVVRLAAARGA